MRRLIITALVLAGIAAAAIVVTPALVSSRLAGLDIADRVGAWTGEKVSVHGEPDVSLFPSLAVEVEGVVISGMDGAGREPYVTVPLVRASLNILPLLAGRVEVGTLTLVEPRIHVIRRQPGGGEPSSADADVVQAAFDDVRIDEVILRNGSITHDGWDAGNGGPVTAVNLRFARLGESRAARLSGTFEWQGKMVEFEAEADDVPAVFHGNESVGRLTIAAAPAPSSEDEDSGPDGRDVGVGSSQSLRQLVEQLGIPFASTSTFGPLQVSGTVGVEEAALTLSDAAVEFDGETADGDVTARLGGDGPMLKGSLEFDKLDVGMRMNQPLHTSLAGLFAARLARDWLSRADIDLTVSAREVDVGGRTLSDASATLLARGGRLGLTLNEAGLAGGRITGQVGLETGREGVSARLAACVNEVSVGEVLGSAQLEGHIPLLDMHEPLQGTGTAALELAAEGNSMESFTSSISGVVVGHVRDGSVGGIDVESTLERLVDGNTVIGGGDAPFIPVTGRTEFDLLSTYVPVVAGLAHDGGIRLYNDRYYVSLFGGGDLTRGEIEVEGVALLFDPGAAGGRRYLRPLVQLPFGAGGTIRKPMIVPGIPRFGYGPHQYLETSDAAAQFILPVASTRPAPDRSVHEDSDSGGHGAAAVAGNDRVGEYRDALARCGSGTVP